MKKLLSLVFILSAGITTNALSASCPTHIECPVNTQCVCSPGASSAYARYFYFDVKLQKGFHYECTLSTTIFKANVLDRVSLPKGAEYQQPSSPRFPLQLQVNTINMENQEEAISIRFLVPPSDMADDFQGICHIKDGSV